MKQKILKLLKSRFVWCNMVLSILLLIVLSAVVLFLLKIYTNHGESIDVPNVVGLYELEAQQVIDKAGLEMEVIDSVYIRDQKPGVIVEQTPKQGLNVKSGRVIYLTINSNSKKEITIPNLIGVSERQATSTLSTLGFSISSINIVPSEYSDVLLEIRYNNAVVKAGDKLPDGAALTISVGRNDYNVAGEMVAMPSLIGLSSEEAVRIISDKNLVVGYIGFDQPQPKNDSEKSLYKVYKQIPQPNDTVIPGKRVDIWLSKDLKKQKAQQDTKQDDDFFR